MLRKITSGYKNLLSSTAKILLLCVLCGLIAAIIVYPLWKWAIISPITYSIAVLCLVAMSLVYLLIKKFINVGPYKFFMTILRLLVILLGIIGCVFCILKGKRLLTPFIILSVIIIYGILKFGLKDKKNIVQESE